MNLLGGYLSDSLAILDSIFCPGRPGLETFQNWTHESRNRGPRARGTLVFSLEALIDRSRDREAEAGNHFGHAQVVQVYAQF